MNRRYVISGVALAAVILSFAWLTFCGYMISDTLFPTDEVLLTAADGATVHVLDVERGSVEVVRGSGGVIVFHRVLIPAIIVPFSLIVAFAFMGCGSLLRSWAKPIPAR